MTKDKQTAIENGLFVLGMIFGAVLIKVSLTGFIVVLIFFSLGLYQLVMKAYSDAPPKPKRYSE